MCGHMHAYHYLLRGHGKAVTLLPNANQSFHPIRELNTAPADQFVSLSPCGWGQGVLWGSMQLLLRRTTGLCVPNHA
jgi:hypothetical protein